MYIRRKVFSLLQDETGEERYFSTTDVTLENEEERTFSVAEDAESLEEKDFSDKKKEEDDEPKLTTSDKINIKLNKKLNIKSWEYTFDQVYWLPNSNTWYEKLSFTPIIFIYKYQQVNAWLYKAYKSPHKNNDFLVEVISPYIEDLRTKQICELKINEKYFK